MKQVISYNRFDYKEAQRLFKKNNKLDTLYLVLSQDCNLHCKYCFAPLLNSEKARFTSINVIKKGIDFWIRLLPKDSLRRGLYIILYGGEPLLNKEGVEYAIKYVRDRQSKTKLKHSVVHIFLDTNAILLNKRIAQLCKKYDVEVTIGLDGPKSINDKYRIYKNGKGTFLKVIDKINLLRKIDVPVYISMVITPELLDYDVDLLVQLISRLGIRYIGFNKIRGKALFNIIGEGNINRYLRRADNFLINFWQKAKKYGIREYQVDSILENLRNKYFYHLKCGIFGSHIVIWPNGEIGFCPWSSTFNIGKSYTKEAVEAARNKLIKKYKNIIPLYNPECRRCKALPLCEGVCPFNLFFQEEAKLLLHQNCGFYRKLFKNKILSYETRER